MVCVYVFSRRDERWRGRREMAEEKKEKEGKEREEQECVKRVRERIEWVLGGLDDGICWWYVG